jgi:hypothetical protein
MPGFEQGCDTVGKVATYMVLARISYGLVQSRPPGLKFKLDLYSNEFAFYKRFEIEKYFLNSELAQLRP